MAKDPAFLFYPNDYIGGTMGMTFEEKGAYMELLMMQFNRGHMDGHMVARTIGQLWELIKDKFIQDENGLWYNVRLDEEQTKRKSFTDSRKNNLSGKNQYTKDEGHTSPRMEDVNEDEIIDAKKSINIAFDVFWNLYDKKKDRPKCERKWERLKDKEREYIINYLPAYKESTPDKNYRKDPATFLNNRSWENEILTKAEESDTITYNELCDLAALQGKHIWDSYECIEAKTKRSPAIFRKKT